MIPLHSARTATFGIVIILGTIAYCPGPDTVISLTFVNQTDAQLCYRSHEPSPLVDDCSTPIKPNGSRGSYEVRVVLSVMESGLTIYDRAATCGEWDTAGSTITITQHDGEYVANDRLPDS